jgi:hypothetical protein
VQEAYGENCVSVSIMDILLYIIDSTIKSINYQKNMYYGICYAKNTRIYLQ